MARKTPTHCLADFVEACGARHMVIVLKSAISTASTDLSLHTANEILEFIHNGGLEEPAFANSTPWRNNPDPMNPVIVDSYDFSSGPHTSGYIAFMWQPKTGKWLIKSLKKNDKPDSRFLAIAAALKKAGH